MAIETQNGYPSSRITAGEHALDVRDNGGGAGTEKGGGAGAL